MNTLSLSIPRLPVLSWRTFGGKHQASLPCLLDQPGVHLTTSGRASILLAMEMLGLKSGDKVLVPTYHCPTMIAPVVALGAEPVFYPIASSGGPQLEWLKQRSLDGVTCILAAHYFGLPQPMQALREWCDTEGIALIEDCAHALFGISGTRPVGRWGDISIGSLTKFLSVPEGGCLQVNAALAPYPKLAAPTLKQQFKIVLDILHVAARFGRLTGLSRLILGAYSLRTWLKLSTLQAAQRNSQGVREEPSMDGYSIDKELSHRALTWASTWIANQTPRSRIVERRRRNYDELAKSLAGFNGFRPLFPLLPEGASPYVFPLWVANPDPGYAKLREIGFPVSRWDCLWPDIPKLSGDDGILWSHHVLQLACHQDMNDTEIQTVATSIIELYGQAGTSEYRGHRDAATDQTGQHFHGDQGSRRAVQ